MFTTSNCACENTKNIVRELSRAADPRPAGRQLAITALEYQAGQTQLRAISHSNGHYSVSSACRCPCRNSDRARTWSINQRHIGHQQATHFQIMQAPLWVGSAAKGLAVIMWLGTSSLK